MADNETVAVVKTAFEAFQRGDIPAVLERMADDVHWETLAAAGVPFSGVRRGKTGVAEFFRQLSESEEVQLFEPQEFIAQGERVAVLGRYRARVKATGRTAETPWVMLFTVRGGRIANFYEVYDTAAAERAYQRATTA
jgi:ketosteroid isomerase-like protein